MSFLFIGLIFMLSYSPSLAIGYWLLAIGYWLLAIGYWLLAIGYCAKRRRPIAGSQRVGVSSARLGVAVDGLAGDERRPHSMRFAVKVHTGYSYSSFPWLPAVGHQLKISLQRHRGHRDRKPCNFTPLLPGRLISRYGVTDPSISHPPKS
jgi:hypothetical protein